MGRRRGGEEKEQQDGPPSRTHLAGWCPSKEELAVGLTSSLLVDVPICLLPTYLFVYLPYPSSSRSIRKGGSQGAARPACPSTPGPP